MKVKVKKCSNPIWWYAGMIGQEFNVVDEREYYYEVNYGENDVKYTISKEDCEVIPDVVLVGTIGMETSKEPSGVKTIKMSLDTARELYKDLSSRSDVASVNFKNWLLENFTKEELEPKKGFTWEESFDGEGFCVETQHHALILRARNQPIDITSKRLFKTKEQAESALAFAQLTHIVAKYNDTKTSVIYAYMIGISGSELKVFTVQPSRPLVFFNKSDAETSLEVNKDLWKQYWMIK